MKKFSLNGIEVFPFASEEQILDHIDKNKGILVAINAEKTIKASDRLREIINLNIGYCDGMGAVKAALKKGYKDAIRIPGCELWLKIIARHPSSSYYLIGSTDEVITATQTVYEQNDHTVTLSDPLKELEKQLNQIKMSVLLSKQAAKQAEEKKNEIVMYLAHDIRTPLTTVIGYLSLLHEAPDMPEQQKEKYVKVALDKAERLEKLINELFEITKYNAHTVIIKKENVDLHCLIAQVIDEIYPTLSANGNTAVFTAEDNLSVNADPEKLARVFSNLLRNAASYSYPQTEITISAKRLEHDIQITFENRGKTIPQEQLNSIFEKFNRLDDARLSNTGGAGLGLSIAEEIIHLHGGKITASSQNETIDFVITLPLSA